MSSNVGVAAGPPGSAEGCGWVWIDKAHYTLARDERPAALLLHGRCRFAARQAGPNR